MEFLQYLLLRCNNFRVLLCCSVWIIDVEMLMRSGSLVMKLS